VRAPRCCAWQCCVAVSVRNTPQTASAPRCLQESLAHVLALVPLAPSLSHLEIHSTAGFTPTHSAFHNCLPIFSNLSTLRLTGAALGEGRLLHAIGAASGHALSKLETLTFACCGIGNNDAAQLGAMLQHMPNLRAVALPESDIGAQGLQWLLDHWSRTPAAMNAITYLDLSSNAIGHDGAPPVATSWPGLGSL
jgi:Leucine Rich repeat